MKNKYNNELKKLLRLNPQLAEFQRKRKTAYFIKVALGEVVAIALFAFLYSQFSLYSSSNLYVVWIICAVVALLIPLVFNPFAVFKNKKCGKVSKVNIESRLARSKNNARGVREILIMTMTFVDKNERVHDLELDTRHEKCFFVGDEIILLNALPYPINLTKHDNIVCPYCGNVMPATNRECLGCGKFNIYKNR